MRFTQRVDRVAIKVWDGLAMQLVCGPAVKFAIPGQRHRIGARLCQGFAYIQSFQRCQQINVFQNQLPETREDASTFNRGLAAPFAVQGTLSSNDSVVDILCRSTRDVAQFAAIGRVDQRQGFRRGAP